MKMVDLKIDGREVKFPSGTTVLQAAEELGIDIPRLCHDPELTQYGGCRLCVVEIKGMRNLAASCVTAVSSGMEIYTGSASVVEARKSILELLMANHPNDCLTCEKMGDCRLADYCYLYGVKKGSMEGKSHNYKLEDQNPFIVRDLNKCILCGKCIRACNEITGKDVLDFSYRGFDTKVTAFGDSSLLESDCIFCGNCIAVCPTGALMEKQIKNKARQWDIKKVKTTCPFCGTGCNFDLCVKNGEVISVASNPTSVVNGRALCIKGRFGWDYIYHPKRIRTPLIKKNGEFVTAGWDEALDLVSRRFKEIIDKDGADSFAALSSARCTNEENYLFQKFVRVVMGTNNIDHCART
jgi:NADH-quinone oxidoreductase subunit G